MTFQKGHKIWLGRHHTAEEKRKIGQKLKGRQHTNETKLKISKAKKGSPSYWHGKRLPEHVKKKISKSLTGKKHSLETREKMSRSQRRRLPPRNMDSRSVNHRIRHSAKAKRWRKVVLERDNYTCVWCGKRGGELNADHIELFSKNKERRFDIDNGRTLCISCHIIRHKLDTKKT